MQVTFGSGWTAAWPVRLARVREVAYYKGSMYAGTHAGLYRLNPQTAAWEFLP